MIEERKTINYPKPFGFTYMKVGNAYITVSGMAQHLALEFTATDDRWDPFTSFIPYNTNVTIIVNDDGVRLDY